VQAPQTFCEIEPILVVHDVLHLLSQVSVQVSDGCEEEH